MNKLVLFISLLTFFGLSAQTKDPNKIIKNVRDKFETVRDYEVDVDIKIDISFIKVPDKKAKLFFKQPDKILLYITKGFAMLPKQGWNFSPAYLFKEDFSAIYVKQETVDNVKLDVIKIMPTSDSSEVILSTLHIDPVRNVIRKIETTGKKSGTIQVELKYDSKSEVLPSEARFSFNLGNAPAPENLPNDNQKIRSDRHKLNGPISGKATLTYSNYQINKGIEDSFFVEKEKKK